MEYTLTDTVSEALLLEANLIKRYQPRFNVRLKDDKQYPYLRISLGEPYPRIEVVRRVASDRARYFGPYTSATACYRTLDALRGELDRRLGACVEDSGLGIELHREVLIRIVTER